MWKGLKGLGGETQLVGDRDCMKCDGKTLGKHAGIAVG